MFGEHRFRSPGVCPQSGQKSARVPQAPGQGATLPEVPDGHTKACLWALVPAGRPAAIRPSCSLCRCDYVQLGSGQGLLPQKQSNGASAALSSNRWELVSDVTSQGKSILRTDACVTSLERFQLELHLYYIQCKKLVDFYHKEKN